MSKSILVIEDEIDFLQLLAQILKKRQYHVIEALGGHKAMEILAQESPDFILLDLAMPGIDGFQILAAIQQMAHLKNARIMVITARSQIARQTADYHVDEILLKPIRPEQLLNLLQRYC